MNKYKNIFLSLSLSLSACSATQPIELSDAASKPSEEEFPPLTSRAHFDEGSRLFNQWLDSDSASDALVITAEKHFRTALSAHPHNVLYQITHYNAYATGRSNFLQFDEAELLKYYNKLHPELHSEAITPAFVSYTLSSIAKDSLDLQLSHILRAIKQNPYNPQNWLVAAELYAEKEQYWLGLSSILNALNISPNTPSYNEFLGHILSLLLEQSDCHPQENTIIKRAASAYSNAARLAQNNANDFAWASEAYLRLGLPPLALVQAQKAYALEVNDTTLHMLFNALFFNAKFDKAWQVLQELENYTGNKYYDFEALKTWSEMASSYDETKLKNLIHILASADLSNESNFYALLSGYLLRINKDEHQEVLKANEQPLSHFELQTLALLSTDNTNDVTQTYLSEAKNQCDIDRREFFVLTAKARQTNSWQDQAKWSNRLRQEDYWRFMFRYTPSLNTAQQTSTDAQ